MNPVVGQTSTAASTAPLAGPTGDCDVALDDLSVAAARNQSSSPRNKDVVRQSCCYCGLNQHNSRSMCPARQAICHACGKRGHYSRVCRTDPSPGLSSRGAKKQKEVTKNKRGFTFLKCSIGCMQQPRGQT